MQMTVGIHFIMKSVSIAICNEERFNSNGDGAINYRFNHPTPFFKTMLH